MSSINTDNYSEVLPLLAFHMLKYDKVLKAETDFFPPLSVSITFQIITVSTRQWHFTGQEFRERKWRKITRDILKNSSSHHLQCWHSTTPPPPVQKSTTHTIKQTSNILYRFKVWMLAVKRGHTSQEHVYKHYSSPQNILYLPRGHGKNSDSMWQKHYLFCSLSSIKKKGGNLSKVTGLYLQYRRAQVMDEDCLATPDPTSSMFLYWINTNRMGTAKINDFCNVFTDTFFFSFKNCLYKAKICTFELVRNFKNGKRHLSMQFFF